MKVLLTLCAVLSLNASWAQSNAINLDGTDDVVNTGARITNLNQDFTLEAWIKTTRVKCAIMVCSNGDITWDIGEKAWYIDNTTGKVNFVGRNSGLIYGNRAVNDGLWHHVAVTWDLTGTNVGTGKMYVDGVDVTTTGAVPYNASQTDLGVFRFGPPNYQTNETGTNFYQGSLDEIRIWNVARTAAQISANYATEIDPTSTGLVSYYRFNQGTASGTNTSLTTVPDLTGSNTATLTNFALSGTTSNYVEQPTSFLLWSGNPSLRKNKALRYC